MNKREKKVVWKPFAGSYESPTSMQIQRRMTAFRTLDPDDTSRRFLLMLNDALGKGCGHNPFYNV